MNHHCYHKPNLAEIWLPGLVGSSLILDRFLGFIPTVTHPTGRLVNFFIGLLSLLVLIRSGRDTYTQAWSSLLNRQTNMSTLVALSTGSAWLYSMFIVTTYDSLSNLDPTVYFESAIIILAFVNLAHYFETLAKINREKQLQALLLLQPSNKNIQTIKIGDSLSIKPGEKIPVDGRLLSGQAYINEAILSGEVLPVYKYPGDKIYAGTMNTTTSFSMQAEKLGQNTLLAEIIRQVVHALTTRPAISNLVDNVSAVFVPIVVIIALLTGLYWSAQGTTLALTTMMSILIIACPCALSLATPLSIMHGIHRANQLGLVIRHGNTLQIISKINHLVLDKTETLTIGQPQIIQVITHKEITPERCLQLAASLAQHSEHPIGRAILAFAKKQNIPLKPTKFFQAVAGLGVRGKVDNQWVILGNLRLMTESNIDFSTLIDKHHLKDSLRVFVAYQNKPIGIILNHDPIRPNTASCLEQLREQGVNLTLATGDNHKSTIAVALQLHIQDILSEALPSEKLNKVESLQQQAKTVAMIGWDINDAPALAQADVSIALRTRTDVTIDTCDITLLTHDLTKIPKLINLSRQVTRNINQNLTGVFIYHLLGIPIAAGVLYPAYGILLNPMVAGLAMALSSMAVILNAQRLIVAK